MGHCCGTGMCVYPLGKMYTSIDVCKHIYAGFTTTLISV